MKEPTMEEVLKLVTFNRDGDGTLYVVGVQGNVWGNVEGNVRGSIVGSVSGDVNGSVGGHVLDNVHGGVGGYVAGNVEGSVFGNVGGTINRRQWQFIETPKEKAIRLIEDGKVDEAIKLLQEGE